jgi:protein phosphatase
VYVKCKTDKGKIRKSNEDYVITLKSKRYWLFIVADGMGGANAGEVASKIAALTVRNFIFENFDNYIDKVRLMKDAIIKSNEEVYKQSLKSESYNGMGTTVTCCLIDKDNLYIGHVGDSRAYLINSVGIVKITQDHSYVQELIDRGSITEQEALRHPQRNYITRSVGTDKDVQVDTKILRLNDKDIILICSDGLTSYLDGHEIFDIVSIRKESAVDYLIQLANERGGSDNISIIIARKEGENE